jgi:hypothetical protein
LSSVSSSLNRDANLTSSLFDTSAPARTCRRRRQVYSRAVGSVCEARGGYLAQVVWLWHVLLQEHAWLCNWPCVHDRQHALCSTQVTVLPAGLLYTTASYYSPCCCMHGQQGVHVLPWPAPHCHSPC